MLGWPNNEEDGDAPKHVIGYVMATMTGKVKVVPLPKSAVGVSEDTLELFQVNARHPAFPGLGVRTSKSIKRGTVVAYYVGVLRPGQFGSDGPYVMHCTADDPEEKSWVIDAEKYGNATRYINDPRGMASGVKANLAAEEAPYHSKAIKVYAVLLRATRDIAAGEELLYSYEAGFKGYWNHHGKKARVTEPVEDTHPVSVCQHNPTPIYQVLEMVAARLARFDSKSGAIGMVSNAFTYVANDLRLDALEKAEDDDAYNHKRLTMQ